MLFKVGWERVEGTLIAEKHVKKKWDAGGGRFRTIFDYMVEIVDTDGEATRLVIREDTLTVAGLSVGKRVRLLVNKQRTKAAFDTKGPPIGAAADRAARKKRERDAKQARFDQLLKDGRHPKRPHH